VYDLDGGGGGGGGPAFPNGRLSRPRLARKYAARTVCDDDAFRAAPRSTARDFYATTVTARRAERRLRRRLQRSRNGRRNF